MKIRVALTFIACGILAFVWLFSRTPAPAQVTITLHSDPFPLVIGPTQLFFTVTDSAGAAVDAHLSVTGQMMMHEGMLPLNMQAMNYENGVFQLPVNWPMAGPWTLDVSAELPDNRGTVQEQFDIFVYSTAMTVTSNLISYHSASQNKAMNADPEHQLVIIIPQGTRVLMLEGQADDVIPSEIRLNVAGQNTLVIQNNDFVDHIVGPYMVRPGETLRQTFTQPATYQGKCSANVRSTVSIIVEG